MAVEDIVKDITERLGSASNVDAVFGEPRKVGRKTIIPIASVGIGFGAGGGQGRQSEEGEEPSKEGTGSGGGGGGCAKPLAVLEVTDEETNLIPIIDVTRVILSSLCFAGAATWMITKLIGRLNKG